MQVEEKGGTYKKPVVQAPVRQVSQKPPVKSEVKAPVKTKSTAPSKPSPRVVQGTGLTPRLATRIVQENYNGNVQKAWHDYAPSAIKDFMRQGMSFAEARAEARDEFGFDITSPTDTGPKLWSNFSWNPDYSAEPTASVGTNKAAKKYYYSGGGGGGGGYTPAPPVAPDTKIRTTAGIRRSPYWTSEDPYASVFEPRFVVLGNSQAW